MMPSSVHQLLERIVDTPIKLHCVMLFAQRVITQGTTKSIAKHISHDIWSIEQAIKELVEAGILQRTDSDVPQFIYQPRPYLNDVLELLLQSYSDPLERNEIQDYIREVARYAPYRKHFNWVGI